MKMYFSTTQSILAILLSLSITLSIQITSYANNAPVFDDGDSTSRSVRENTAADENIGDLISATHEDTNDTLTYSLSGTDADSFDIDSTSGQLKTVDALDYETKTEYSVTITVSDNNDATDSIDVTVNVKDIVDLSTPLSERTAKVRDAIENDLKSWHRVNAADIGDSALLKLTSLNMHNKNISSLKSTDFSGLTNLEAILLNQNSLSTLPADIFDGLSNLEYISLGRNSLSSLPEDVFDGLSNLEKIILSVNPLETLPEDIFDGLSNLEVLLLQSMKNHALNSLPEDVFDGLSNLEVLKVNGNSLSSLPADLFDGLSSLKRLDISFNDLTALPDGIFQGLTDLTTLSLDSNERGMVCRASLIKVSDGIFKAKINTAAPFDMELTVSTNDAGSIHGEATTITVSAGSLESDTLTVRRNVDTYQAATVTIGTPLPGKPRWHTGYRIAKSNDLPLEILPEISRDPVFNDGDSATRSVAENTASDRNFGDPITASSWNSTYTMTYTLGGTDADSFDIDSETGRLKTNSALNYESKNTYAVTITATDDDDFSSTIDVTINVTDVNEPPRFSANSITLSVDENTDADENIGDPVSATDPDADDTLDYSLLGKDRLRFSMDSETGQLKVKAKLDYEKKKSYSVLIRAHDSGYKSDSINVTIDVNNLLDESLPLSERTSEVATEIFSAINRDARIVESYNDVTEAHLLGLDSYLHFTNDDIGSVKSGDFGGLKNLKDLYLDYNSFETLPANIFNPLSNLEELKLHGNEFETLPSTVFNKLTKLKELTLGYNDFETLPEDIFDKLTKLEVLELDGNDIDTLPSDIFNKLTKLKTLDLQHHNFSSLPNNIFKGLTSLETLKLQTNRSDIEIPVTIVKNEISERIQAKIATAAPFEMTLPFNVTNGFATNHYTSFTIEQGKTTSNAVTVIRSDAQRAVTMTFGTLPSIPNEHSGYTLVKSDDLPITLQDAPAAPSLTEAVEIPDTTEFLPNYPNPFNPETWIPYQLANRSTVQITIYNTQDVVVRHLDLGHQPAGYYTSRSRAAHWDGRNAAGERIASGLYFYRFEADNMSVLRKMVILK